MTGLPKLEQRITGVVTTAPASEHLCIVCLLPVKWEDNARRGATWNPPPPGTPEPRYRWGSHRWCRYETWVNATDEWKRAVRERCDALEVAK